MSILKPRVSFSSNFASFFIAMKHNSSAFFHLNLFMLWTKTKHPIKVQIFRLSTACMKISQIPYVIFQATSQFYFKFCISLQCHDTKFLWIFLTKTLQYMLWTKRAHQCTIFQTFECSNESSPNSLCHLWNHKVRVYSNSVSLFSVMKDDSCIIFSSNLIYFGQK